MDKPFTMEEFVQKHGLRVDTRNPQQTRVVARWLKEQGFTSRTVSLGGKRGSRWAREWPDRASAAELRKELDSVTL